MLTEWRIRMVARERARVREHQADGHGWCAGCLAHGYVEEWPCITVGTAVLAVKQLEGQLDPSDAGHAAPDAAGGVGPEPDRLGRRGLPRPQIHDRGNT